MAKYHITTDGELCTAFDDELGVQVEWIKGKFYATQDTMANRYAPCFAELSDDEYLVVLAMARNEICEYVQAKRPELL